MTDRAKSFAGYVRRTAIWIPTLVVGLLALPVIATQRTFGPDWTLHLWAIRQQQWNIRAMGHPGLFVSATPLGVFYPLFAFVGSGIYAVGGYLGLFIGAVAAYRLLFVVGLCIAYGGSTWLATQFGLSGWRSQMPGAVLVTGAYYVTDMVGRGDFGEFIALSSIPLVIASVRAIATAPRVRTWQRLALVGGVFILTGSHNITLLWGTTFALMLVVVAAIAWWPTWRERWRWPRVAQAAGLGLIGAGVNAWYLLPDLRYSLDTRIARAIRSRQPIPNHIYASALLDPLRPGDTHPLGAAWGRDIRLSLPLVVLAWVVVAGILLWRRRDRAARLLFIGLAVITGYFVTLVPVVDAWKYLPHIYWSVQFTYRASGYVLIGASLLVLVVLVWDSRHESNASSALRVALAGVVLFSVGLATWQVWQVRPDYYSYRKLAIYAAPAGFADTVVQSHYNVAPSWYSIGDFLDVSAKPVTPSVTRFLFVPYPAVHGSHFAGTLPVPEGPAPFSTNIAGGPRFVRMTGIVAVGRDAHGLVVAQRAPGAARSGPLHVTIDTARNKPIVLGFALSVVSVVLLVGVGLWPVLRRLRRRPTPAETV